MIKAIIFYKSHNIYHKPHIKTQSIPRIIFQVGPFPSKERKQWVINTTYIYKDAVRQTVKVLKLKAEIKRMGGDYIRLIDT